jgi:hypothetical protein
MVRREKGRAAFAHKGESFVRRLPSSNKSAPSCRIFEKAVLRRGFTPQHPSSDSDSVTYKEYYFKLLLRAAQGVWPLP